MKRVGVSGFTIVETMIVLAVTGVIFLALVGAVSGQQGKAQFKNAVQGVAADIQSSISQVANGYYPIDSSQFSCGVDGVTGIPRLTATGSSADRGVNQACTFLGQAYMFGTNTDGDSEEYRLQTLIGLRRTPTGDEPLNLNQARVRVAAPGNGYPTSSLPFDREIPRGPVSHGHFAGFTEVDSEGRPTINSGAWPDLSVARILPFGAKIQWMRIDDGTNNGDPVAGFAIVTAPNSQVGGADGSSVQSGVVIPSVFAIPCGTVSSCSEKGTAPKNGVDAIVRALDTNGASAVPQGVRLCFLSGSTEQSGLIVVGAHGSNDSVEVTIHNSLDCSTGGPSGPVLSK